MAKINRTMRTKEFKQSIVNKFLQAKEQNPYLTYRSFINDHNKNYPNDDLKISSVHEWVKKFSNTITGSTEATLLKDEIYLVNEQSKPKSSKGKKHKSSSKGSFAIKAASLKVKVGKMRFKLKSEQDVALFKSLMSSCPTLSSKFLD